MRPPIRTGWLLAAVIGAGLAWLAGGWWSRPNDAMAQIDIGGSGDVVVVPMQMTPSTNGFILVDKLHQTICLYEYRPTAAADRQGLVLLAARNYRYDTQLEDYNTAQPRPDDVKQLLLHAERMRQEQAAPKKTPASERTDVVVPSPGVGSDKLPGEK